MAKRGRARRRGIQRGIQKHKIRSSPLGSKNIFQLFEQLLPTSYVSLLHASGAASFQLYSRACTTLGLLPLSMDENGKFKTASTYKRVFNCFILGLLAVSMMHKLWVAGSRMADGQVNATTFICISCFLINLVAFCISTSSLWLTEETIDIINDWPSILRLCSEEDDENVPTVFGKTKTSFFVTALAILASAIALAASSANFILRDMPVSLHQTAEAHGLISPERGLLRALWKLGFWPLEFLCYMPPMLIAGWSAMALITMFMVVQTCAEELRKIPVEDQDSRVKLWQKYMMLQVHQTIVNNWVRFMIVPTISSASSTVIVSFYIALRHPEIHTLLYLVFCYVGVTLFGVIFWLCYEVITLIRATEGIVGTLGSREDSYFQDLPEQKQRYLMRLGKATRPIYVEIGDFMHFSLDVPIGIWDEIVNQLMFLLSF